MKQGSSLSKTVLSCLTILMLSYGLSLLVMWLFARYVGIVSDIPVLIGGLMWGTYILGYSYQEYVRLGGKKMDDRP